MNHQELYKLIATVQKNVHCPQCGKTYTFSQIKIRGIVEGIIFLELNCKNHMPLLATVAMPANKKQSAVTKREKINSDDVLQTHKALETFSGTFEQMFKLKN